MESIVLKKKIVKFAQDGLVKHLNISQNEAQNLIKQSSLEKSIDRAPDVVAHYTQEQLVSYIIR